MAVCCVVVFSEGFCSDQANAAVDRNSDDNCQIGHSTANGNDDRLHHVKVVSNNSAICTIEPQSLMRI